MSCPEIARDRRSGTSGILNSGLKKPSSEGWIASRSGRPMAPTGVKFIVKRRPRRPQGVHRIMKLPKQDAIEWQPAISCLIGAAEGRDFPPTKAGQGLAPSEAHAASRGLNLGKPGGRARSRGRRFWQGDAGFEIRLPLSGN